jgi:hypothetical protein
MKKLLLLIAIPLTAWSTPSVKELKSFNTDLYRKMSDGKTKHYSDLSKKTLKSHLDASMDNLSCMHVTYNSINEFMGEISERRYAWVKQSLISLLNDWSNSAEDRYNYELDTAGFTFNWMEYSPKLSSFQFKAKLANKSKKLKGNKTTIVKNFSMKKYKLDSGLECMVIDQDKAYDEFKQLVKDYGKLIKKRNDEIAQVAALGEKKSEDIGSEPGNHINNSSLANGSESPLLGNGAPGPQVISI